MRFSIMLGEEESLPSKPTDSVQQHEAFNRHDFTAIESIIGYQFKDKTWLERAFTHRSAPSSKIAEGGNDYERLEFLGDAVLDLAIADLLLSNHLQAKEGDLSKMRAALVNTASLADIAKTLGLGSYIRLSRGELTAGGAERPSILADVFEALMGAIYREAGFDAAMSCVKRLFANRVSDVNPRDPKTELQEILHATGSEPPTYLLECVEGPEHAPAFVSVVQVDGQIVGRGRGNTKKASQQMAAEEALKRLRGGDEIDQQILNNMSRGV